MGATDGESEARDHASVGKPTEGTRRGMAHPTTESEGGFGATYVRLSPGERVLTAWQSAASAPLDRVPPAPTDLGTLDEIALRLIDATQALGRLAFLVGTDNPTWLELSNRARLADEAAEVCYGPEARDFDTDLVTINSAAWLTVYSALHESAVALDSCEYAHNDPLVARTAARIGDTLSSLST